MRDVPARRRLQGARRLELDRPDSRYRYRRWRCSLFIGKSCTGGRLGSPPARNERDHRDAKRRAGREVEITRALGAEVVLYDRNSEDREAISADISDRTGAVIVPPYDHTAVIAGQGAVGLEAMQQMEEIGAVPDTFLVPCSGGGLIAGCAIAVKDAAPHVNVLAAEPEHFDDTARSLAAGKRLANSPGSASICDALLVPTPGKLTFEIMRRTLSGGVAVTEDDVKAAVRAAYLDARVVVEPGGAVGLAAVLSGKLAGSAKNICVVMSGGNIDRKLFADILTG